MFLDVIGAMIPVLIAIDEVIKSWIEIVQSVNILNP